MLKNLINRVLHKVAYVAPGGKRFRPWLHRRRGAHIGRDVWISQYVYIDEIHPEGVTIGDNCTIGLRTSIFSHFYWGPKKENRIKGDVRAERALRFKNLLRVIWGQTKLEYCKKRLGSGLGYLDIERRYLGKKKDFSVRSWHEKKTMGSELDIGQ